MLLLCHCPLLWPPSVHSLTFHVAEIVKARHVMPLKENRVVPDELNSGVGVAEVGRCHKVNNKGHP